MSVVHPRSLQFVVTLAADAGEGDLDAVLARIAEAGADVRVTPGRESTVIGVIGEPDLLEQMALDGMRGVVAVTPVARAHKLVARETSPDPTLIQVRGRRVGAGYFALVAGPCTVESREQTLVTARAVQQAGATMLRGGAFKPRTSPYAFRGLGVEGLRILEESREETGLPLVTEVMDARQVEVVAEVADVLQIGARNMQNFTLLAEVGAADKPVLLKRGPSSSIEELLLAAEHVVTEGNPRVILCERGIRTFERSTRYTLDIGAVPVLKEETHLPVIVDPSHAAGRRSLVPALACAAVAAGADGIIVEAHPAPDEALCDAAQLLPTAEFGEFAAQVISLVEAMGKVMG